MGESANQEDIATFLVGSSESPHCLVDKFQNHGFKVGMKKARLALKKRCHPR